MLMAVKGTTYSTGYRMAEEDAVTELEMVLMAGCKL